MDRRQKNSRQYHRLMLFTFGYVCVNIFEFFEILFHFIFFLFNSEI